MRFALAAFVCLGLFTPTLFAAEPSKAELERQFEEKLTGVRFVGKFTLLGKEDQTPKEESYEITSVMKTDTENVWLFKTRIMYGDKDVTVPLPLEVRWAGDTPVISLTDFTIPQMGTFSARVVIYKNKYAGTWSHGEKGGHLFGRIEKLKSKE